MTDQAVIIDVDSGEEQTRPLTAAEQTQREADAVEAEQRRSQEQTAATERGEADTQLSAVRAKAKEVAAGTSAFTAAQTQKILAHLVLRATR